jgi:predicted transport protein
MEEIYRGAEGPTRSKAVAAASEQGSTPFQDKPEYTIEGLFEPIDEGTRQLYSDLDDFIMSLDTAMTAVPLKTYVAYKLARNVVCVEPSKRKKLLVWIQLDHRPNMPNFARDMRNIGHHGTGNLEMVISNPEELVEAYELIREAYLNSGGN